MPFKCLAESERLKGRAIWHWLYSVTTLGTWMPTRASVGPPPLPSTGGARGNLWRQVRFFSKKVCCLLRQQNSLLKQWMVWKHQRRPPLILFKVSNNRMREIFDFPPSSLPFVAVCFANRGWCAQVPRFDPGWPLRLAGFSSQPPHLLGHLNTGRGSHFTESWRSARG